MVSLLCHCCKRDYIYVPNFLLGRNSSFVEGESYFNNILYKRFNCNLGGVVSKVATLTSPHWLSDYIHIGCVFYTDNGNPFAIRDLPFPLSPYDYIDIYFLKPEYLGVNVGHFINAYIDGVYDHLRFSWVDFTPSKVSKVLDILMNRFDPLFSPDYFYYSDDGLNSNPYSVHYSYDEFLVSFRSWLYSFFIDFYKNGSLRAFSPYCYIANKGQFTFEKEQK